MHSAPPAHIRYRSMRHTRASVPLPARSGHGHAVGDSTTEPVYPAWQSLLARQTILVLLAAGFVFNIRRGGLRLPSAATIRGALPDADRR